MSDTPAEVKLSSALDFTTAYKVGYRKFLIEFLLTVHQKYNIARRMPMLVAKQEKTLAVDGVYLHVSNILVHY